MIKISIKDEYIKLGQLIKLAGLADSGLEAKLMIVNGNVKLNGNTELQRGKKVVPGDLVECKGEKIEVSYDNKVI
jgi:ribosome-associated protein